MNKKGIHTCIIKLSSRTVSQTNNNYPFFYMGISRTQIVPTLIYAFSQIWDYHILLL